MNKSDKDNIDYFDYFHTKCGSDISDLFLNLKEISNGFCINLFNSTKQNQNGSYNLTEFIFDQIILKEEIENENNEEGNNSDIEEEENIY